MNLTMLKAKLHMARVTQADLDYEGSLAIDSDLLDDVGILPYEKILVANVENGERLETYAISAERGSRTICLNGAAAHKGKCGDRIIIFAFGCMSQEEAQSHQPRVLVLDDGNNVIRSSG